MMVTAIATSALTMAAAGATSATPTDITGPTDFTATLGSTTPGAATTLNLRFVFRHPDGTDAKPPAAVRAIMTLPAAIALHTDQGAACTADDADLILRGTLACPAETKVGDGYVVFDASLPAPLDRVRFDMNVFNNPAGPLALGSPPGAAAIVGIDRLTWDGTRLVANLPFEPGGPPDLRTAYREVSILYRQDFVTTPATCPSDGQWPYSAVVEFADGSIQQTPAKTVPCTR